MSVTDQQAARATEPPKSTRGSTVLWLLLSLAAAAGLAAVVGWGPPIVRRPLLTPLAAGALLGGITAFLLRFTSARATPVGNVVAAVCAVASLIIAHWLAFTRIEAETRRWVSEHPRDAQLLSMLEQADDHDASPADRRARRLQLRPTWTDYLASRAAVLLGDAIPFGSVLLLVVEGAGAALIAAWTFRQSLRGSGAGHASPALE